MFTKCKTSKEQGNIGLAQAIAYFTSMCYTVCTPLNDSQDYDLVVDIDNILHKVQVKTTNYKVPSGSYQACLKSSGGTKGKIYSTVSEGNCTLLFILCGNGDRYLIPHNVFKNNKVSITLNDSMLDYYVI